MRRVSALSAALLLLCATCFAQSSSTYTGKTGSKDATFVLNWGTGSRVTGYYFTDDSPNRHYRLSGRNDRSGQLLLREYDHGRMTARIQLRKRVVGGQVRWSGTMFNTDGRRIPVTLTRD